MKCPDCGAKVEPPRASWFKTGVKPVDCPNGHRLELTNTFTPNGESAADA